MDLRALPWWHSHRWYLGQGSRLGLMFALAIPFWLQWCLWGGMGYWLSMGQSNTVSQQLGWQLRQEIALRAWQIVEAKLAQSIRQSKSYGMRSKNTPKSMTDDGGGDHVDDESAQGETFKQLVPAFQDLSTDLQVNHRETVVIFDPERFADSSLDGGQISQMNDLTLSAIGYVQWHLQQQSPEVRLKHQQHLVFERGHQRYYLLVLPYVPQSYFRSSGFRSSGWKVDNFQGDDSQNFSKPLASLLVLVIVPEERFLNNVPWTRAPLTKAMVLWSMWLGFSLGWVWLVSQWLRCTITQITLDCQEITTQINQANSSFSHIGEKTGYWFSMARERGFRGCVPPQAK